MVQLQAVSDQTMKQVIRSETTEILTDCVKKTKVAKKDVVQRKEQLGVVKGLGYTQARAKGSPTINAGWRKAAPYGRVWLRVRESGGRKAFILARGPDFSTAVGKSTLHGKGEWAQNVASAASSALGRFPAAIARGWSHIGLARKSWVQIGEALRLNIRGLMDGEARIAAGAHYINGTGNENGTKGKYFVNLINKLPYCRRAKLDAILARAVNARTTYFQKAIKKGVFDSMSMVSQKYPGLIVR